jgi:hypothetical protein
MEQTVRFSLPFLAPGQAQKEWFHNEALQRIDFLMSAIVEGAPLATPPAVPVPGVCYLIAAGATGEWQGMDGMLAGHGEGGWRFAVPVEGMRAVRRDTGEPMLFRGGVWETGIIRGAEIRVGGQAVVRGRGAVIDDPSGGTTVDTEGRAAISSILQRLRAHGLIEA